MRKIVLSLAGLGLFGTTFLPAWAHSGPKVVHRSLILNVEDTERYWPDPKKDPVVGKSAWIPKQDNLHFVLEGPMDGGGKLWMEFIKSDGKSWIQTECTPTDSLDNGQVADVNCNTIEPQKAILDTGNFGFKIHYDNASKGIHTELFKGNFKVGTYLNKETKKPNFYINEDWRVPTGYVSLDVAAEPDAPTFRAYFWFKHRDLNFEKLTAQLFYNGKAVGSNTAENNFAENISDRKTYAEPVDAKQDYSYQLWKFVFANVRGKLENPDSYEGSNLFVLNKNPGNYELKVMYGGKLVRTAAFSVGSNGKIAAPGSVEKDSNGNQRFLIPTKVMGDVDLVWDKNAYKTDVYYGNPSPLTSGILAP